VPSGPTLLGIVSLLQVRVENACIVGASFGGDPATVKVLDKVLWVIVTPAYLVASDARETSTTDDFAHDFFDLRQKVSDAASTTHAGFNTVVVALGPSRFDGIEKAFHPALVANHMLAVPIRARVHV
jgi:hypothetical protein